MDNKKIFKGMVFVPPFDPYLLKKMVLIPYKDLIKRYGTYDLVLLEKRVRQDFEDRLICLPFGDARAYPNKEGVVIDWGLHCGVDYFIPEGTPIYAITESKIRHAKNIMTGYRDWGNIVITTIGKENSLFVLYAHIDIEESVFEKAKNGGVLKRGELIGKIAKGFTKENGNWPAHFHLQISKEKYYSGYVQKRSDLNMFINPNKLFPIKD